MRLVILSAATFLFCISCDNNQKKETGTSSLNEAEVRDFISRYDAMWASRDTNSMKKAMDEQYIYFTSTGSTRSRSDIINWFTPADKYKVEKAERSEISAQLKGNTAIVSSRWVGNGSFGNEKFDDDQRCGFVIQKVEGRLKLVAEHCVQIARENDN